METENNCQGMNMGDKLSAKGPHRGIILMIKLFYNSLLGWFITLYLVYLVELYTRKFILLYIKYTTSK